MHSYLRSSDKAGLTEGWRTHTDKPKTICRELEDIMNIVI